MSYLYLTIAIVAEVIATSFLKQADGFTKPLPSAIIVAGYGVAFYCLSLALRTVPVGIAYAIWSGIGIVLIAVVAWLIHGQKLDFPAIIGIGFIAVGIVVMNVFSKTTGH